jgi:hypothetical protein
MPQFGTGLVPQSPVGVSLTYITARGVIPNVYLQVFTSTPTLFVLLSNRSEHTGGVSSISAPVVLQNLTPAQWMSYNANFAPPPSDLQGMLLAEWNTCVIGVPVPISLPELLLQEGNAIIPILEARANSVAMAFQDALSNAIFTNSYSGASANTLAIEGFPDAIDDGTNATTYGGISRTTYPQWKSTRYTLTNVAPTRTDLIQRIAGVSRTMGEKPTAIIMGFGTWSQLASDFLGIERMFLQPGQEDRALTYHAGFDTLMVAGVPVYCDVYCPEGTAYIINTNYLKFSVHEDLYFVWSDWYSLIPAYSVAWVGIDLLAGQLVNLRPNSCGVVTGYTYVSL